MSEGQGIHWGGMIKGAVKITAVVAVSIGIMTGIGLGLQLLPVDSTGILGSAAKAGGVIVSSVTGATEYIASALTAPLSGLLDAFTGGENAVSRNPNVEALSPNYDAAKAPDGVSPEARTAFGGQIPTDILSGDLSTKIDEAVKAFSAGAEGVAGAMQGIEGELAKAIDAYKAAGVAVPEVLTQMQSQIQALPDLLDKVASASTGEEAVKAFDALAEKLNLIDNQRAALEGATDYVRQDIFDAKGDAVKLKALEGILEQNTALLGGSGMDAVYDKAANLRDVLTNGLGIMEPQVELKNVPEAWAAIGAGGVALGAAHHLGRAKGQREVVGAFTQAEMDRRSAMARMAGGQQMA